MSLLNQKTIKSAIEFNGVGLHSGKKVQIKLLPAEPNTGVVFKRTDVKKNNFIVPNIFNVSSAILCTKISNDFGVSISTIEHLMAALFGLGIDNVLVEIDNEEVPILDGSAKIFVEKILNSGFTVSENPIKVIRINNNISLVDGKKFISIEPSKINLEIDFEIKYENQFIGTQKNKINVFEDDLTDIFDSRTFCLFEDIEKLKKINLGRGGSLDNAIVVKNNEIINDEKLRNDFEFVNHKILDCMGDLYLSGYKVIGKLKCSQGGHKLTNDLLRQVFLDQKNYSIIEINEKTLPHTLINKQNLKYIA